MMKHSRVVDGVPSPQGMANVPAKSVGSGRAGKLPDGNATEWHRAWWTSDRFHYSAPNSSRPEHGYPKRGLLPRPNRRPAPRPVETGGLQVGQLKGKMQAHPLHARVQEVSVRRPARPGRP